jgi:Tol biopolymer transport system component
MDQNKRTFTDQPVLASKKSFAIIGSALACLLFILSACSSLPKPLTQPPPRDYLLLKGARQLTFEGNNDSPSFSPHGDKIIFVSHARASHRNSQVYEIELLRNKERRITFQDGEVLNPIYVDDDEIIYSSTTDEIKESIAEMLGPNAFTKERPPTELYQSDLFGNDIERLTNFPGYDDQAVYIPEKKPFLIFTSYRGGLLGIFKYDYRFKNASLFLVEKGRDRWSPTVSSDFKYIAWLEKDLDKKTNSMMLSPLKDLKPRVLKQENYDLRDLHFIHNSSKLIYSAKSKNDPLFHIELFDFQKNCTQVVFSGQDSLIQPSYSPGSPDRVVFTRVLKDSQQIYLVDVPNDLGPCLESNH